MEVVLQPSQSFGNILSLVATELRRLQNPNVPPTEHVEAQLKQLRAKTRGEWFHNEENSLVHTVC